MKFAYQTQLTKLINNISSVLKKGENTWNLPIKNSLAKTVERLSSSQLMIRHIMSKRASAMNPNDVPRVVRSAVANKVAVVSAAAVKEHSTQLFAVSVEKILLFHLGPAVIDQSIAATALANSEPSH